MSYLPKHAHFAIEAPLNKAVSCYLWQGHKENGDRNIITDKYRDADDLFEWIDANGWREVNTDCMTFYKVEKCGLCRRQLPYGKVLICADCQAIEDLAMTFPARSAISRNAIREAIASQMNEFTDNGEIHSDLYRPSQLDRLTDAVIVAMSEQATSKA